MITALAAILAMAMNFPSASDGYEDDE